MAVGFNAPRFESIWKKLRKRGGGNAACLGVSRWACFPLLDSGFTPVSVPIGQAGLGIFLVFRVRSLRFLFSEVEMGLSVLVSVSSVRWKSARKVGADCSASLPVPYGAAVTEQTDSVQQPAAPVSCWLSWALSAALLRPGLSLCPGHLLRRRHSRVCWVPLTVIGVVGTAFRLGHRDAEGSTCYWGVC